MKNFVKLCLHNIQATQCILQKNHEKIRESLFTFKLHITEHLSFKRDFAQKIQNSI